MDALFDELDADGSGSVDYAELSAKLRAGLDVEIAAELQEGAVAFDTTAANRFALRTDVDERTGPLKLLSIDELRHSLLEGAGRVASLFTLMDRDGDGCVSRDEFRLVLPLLNFDTSAVEIVDAVFDELDVDGGGTLEYAELASALGAHLSVELPAHMREGALGDVDEWGGIHANAAYTADVSVDDEARMVKVQAAVRGRQARANARAAEEHKVAVVRAREEERAATRMQASARGHAVREQMGARPATAEVEAEAAALALEAEAAEAEALALEAEAMAAEAELASAAAELAEAEALAEAAGEEEGAAEAGDE